MMEKYIQLYGESVSTNSEEYREACEARSLLRFQLEHRRREISAIVKKRGHGDPAIEHQTRDQLQKSLTREWEWRQSEKQKETANASAT